MNLKRYDLIYHEMLWHDMQGTWFDMIWYDMIWYVAVWYDMINLSQNKSYDVIWTDMIIYVKYHTLKIPLKNLSQDHVVIFCSWLIPPIVPGPFSSHCWNCSEVLWKMKAYLYFSHLFCPKTVMFSFWFFGCPACFACFAAEWSTGGLACSNFTRDTNLSVPPCGQWSSPNVFQVHKPWAQVKGWSLSFFVGSVNIFCFVPRTWIFSLTMF